MARLGSEFGLTKELPLRLSKFLPDPKEIEAEIRRELGDGQLLEEPPQKQLKPKLKKNIKRLRAER
jgi:hypothetical protein